MIDNKAETDSISMIDKMIMSAQRYHLEMAPIFFDFETDTGQTTLVYI